VDLQDFDVDRRSVPVFDRDGHVSRVGQQATIDGRQLAEVSGSEGRQVFDLIVKQSNESFEIGRGGR
jgi:hypothetical protein